MRSRPPTWLLALVTFGLFAVWSNSFVAMSYLLGAERTARSLDWVELTVARFSCAGLVCAAFLLARHRRAGLALARAHPLRMVACGLLVVPVYNLALYYAQEHGVSPPIASLTTALVPLFVLLLSRAFLGERLSARKLVGLLFAFGGMLVIATARGSLRTDYPWMVLLAVTAPVCWSLYTVLSKPIVREGSALVWSYSTLVLGSLFVVPGLPHTWPSLTRLDAAGWGALLYLAVPCAVLGNAVWTWLLRHLPASSVGFTVFLNPPLTTASKWLLALALPATFRFTPVGREFLGAAIVLLGMGIALRPSPNASS